MSHKTQVYAKSFKPVYRVLTVLVLFSVIFSNTLVLGSQVFKINQAQAANATGNLSMPAVNLNAGSTVTVPLSFNVTNGDMAGFMVQLTYDKSILTIAADSDVTPATGAGAFNGLMVANAAASANTSKIAGAASAGQTGNLVLANIKFTAVSKVTASTVITVAPASASDFISSDYTQFSPTPSAVSVNATVTGNTVTPPPVKPIVPNPAATPIGVNMIKGNSFETDINTNWAFWNNSARTITAARSYDPAFGQGSYSLSIEAIGSAAARTDAGMVSNNNSAFLIQAGKTYVLRYYAKSTANSQISALLENANTYVGSTPLVDRAITTDWQQYSIVFTPNVTSDTASFLTFFYGDLPNGAILNLDGLTLQEINYKLSTTEVKGLIGDNKSVALNNLALVSDTDIDIELPYYDNLTSQVTTKKFKPTSISGTTVNFKMPVQTFSGLGKVYVLGNLVGQFNYNVQPKIVELYPTMLRADQDLSLKVSGFNPNPGNSFIVVKSVNINGKTFETWIKPYSFDSQLSYVTVKLPIGVTSGAVYMQTSFQNIAGKVVENKTAAIAYKVMPVIYLVEWSSKGFEQVGDKIKIHGKGISGNPTVNFYDTNDKRVASRSAKVIDINSTEEVIEVNSIPNLTSAKVTVTVNGVETDVSTPLTYLAKPRMTLITAKNRRIMSASGESLPAAKIGEEITIAGSAFNVGSTSPIAVEFQGYNQRFSVNVDSSKVTAGGTALKVTVPTNAQSGFLTVISNGQKSNYKPLEIIPKLVSITPDPIVPGSNMTINAQGVGNNLNLLKVVFNLTTNEKVEVAASSLTVTDAGATIVLQAPMAISNKYSSINIKYDRWQDDGVVNLNVRPTITSAAINLDDKILVIKGYGFSINPIENQITYMYADANHTVVTPKVQMLGVYPTEDGQEIRIKILDGYHYGYVTVKTGDYTSSEANFGPVSIKKIVRRVEAVPGYDQPMGVLYIYGYNFDLTSNVRVGTTWATAILNQSQFYIKAVVYESHLYDNPVIVTKYFD